MDRTVGGKYLFWSPSIGGMWLHDYPEGKDPLLAAWQHGHYGAHPNWNNKAFWASIGVTI